MPEYLAPGVFVEETSFRGKSIEGVGTTTTGFVGPTRKGPTAGPAATPELLTSFADFEWVYGGLGDLDYGTNYLAHAVRAFFNEGGSRLYVARVDGDGAAAATADVLVGATPAAGVQLRARGTGTGGNGAVTLTLVETPVVRRAIERAPEGTVLKVGTKFKPARIVGGAGPYRLPNNSVLRLKTDAGNLDVTFKGGTAEAVAQVALPDPVVVSAGNTSITVTIDGVEQKVPIPTGSTARAGFVTAVAGAIPGVSARLTTGADAGAAGRLVIGVATSGTRSSVRVSQNNEVGFTAAAGTAGGPPVGANVPDLNNVTIADVNALLGGAGGAVRASGGADRRLVLATAGTQSTTSLAVRTIAANPANPPDAFPVLGLSAAAAATGTGTADVRYFVRRGAAFVDAANPAVVLDLGSMPTANDGPPGGGAFLTATVVAADADGNVVQFDDVGLAPGHPRYVGTVLAANPKRRADAIRNPVAIAIGADVTPAALRDALFAGASSNTYRLAGGTDGAAPGPAAYEDGLAAFDALEDLSIVAAPGLWDDSDAQAIHNALIAHVEQPRAYRIAVLDTPPGQVNGDAIETRGKLDSTRAALYHPWVVVPNPLAGPASGPDDRELTLPPSGFVCGIYARSDVARGVFKAPANEVVRAALRFERDINFRQQEQLNPVGVNCLRYLSGRGYRVWGARTATSDPEWKYVNVRRYFNYLEASIDRGTQWAVFEPNGPRLWANVRDTISDFLYTEWLNGALLGGTPEEAFFVKCDRTTITQNDLDNGRLICLIGVAVVKPAEFVIFRVGQKTAEARA